jgi:hypothetical protein
MAYDEKVALAGAHSRMHTTIQRMVMRFQFVLEL